MEVRANSPYGWCPRRTARRRLSDTTAAPTPVRTHTPHGVRSGGAVAETRGPAGASPRIPPALLASRLLSDAVGDEDLGLGDDAQHPAARVEHQPQRRVRMLVDEAAQRVRRRPRVPESGDATAQD